MFKCNDIRKILIMFVHYHADTCKVFCIEIVLFVQALKPKYYTYTQIDNIMYVLIYRVRNRHVLCTVLSSESVYIKNFFFNN